MQNVTEVDQKRTAAFHSNRLWNTAVITLILAGALVVTSRTIADPDLWGHERFGLDTITNRRVMQVDPYSYLTAGQRWINHEWLAELTFAYAWLLGKATGLVLIKTSLWILTYIVLYKFLIDRLKVPLRVGILLFLSMLLTFPFFITVRPQSYTALLYSLILIIIVRAESGRYRGLWFCPLIFALWPNLHGAFLAGLGILGLWAVLHLLFNRNRRVWVQVIPPLLVSCAALLINPYGTDLMIFLFNNLGDPRLEITEWQPLQLHSMMGAFYLFWLALVIIGLFFSRKPRNPILVILLVLTAYLPFMALRYVLFFILTAIIFAGEHLGDAWERVMPVRTSTVRRSQWVPILAIIVALGLLAWKLPNFTGIPIKNPEYYPIAAVSLLNQSGVEGNLAIHFDWGDYVIWHLSPGTKVSLDTRREMAYSEQIYKENVRYMTGIGAWSALLDEHPTEMALVKSASPTDNLMQQRPDWIAIYRDEVGALYARKGSPQAERLSQIAQVFKAPENGRYFP